MRILVVASLATLLAGVGPLPARTICIDVTNGSDANPGTSEAPVKTIPRGIALAAPGDVVQLLPKEEPIRETVAIVNKSGEPGNPIIFDGGGNWINACQPINPADWTQVRPGLYRCDRLLSTRLIRKEKPNYNADTVRRFFFVFDGKINRMGRSSKGRSRPLPPVDELKPGEWTYVDEEAAFYIAIDPARTLADYRIEAPLFQNGLATGGTCRYWVVRNLNVARVINDGFNIHGDVKEFRFENISAIECGDDGMSAHSACEVEVDGFVAKRNSTGICHTNQASSKNRRVVLEDNHGLNLYLLGGGTHEFRESRISAKGQGVWLTEPEGNGVTARLTGCEILLPESRELGVKPLLVASGCHLILEGGTQFLNTSN